MSVPVSGVWPSRLLGVLLAGVVLTGCSAAPPPEPSIAPSSAPGSAAPSIPPDGITLAELGFDNGPLRTFSVPRDTQLRTEVDQPNVVTLVIAAPSFGVVADYLRTALPAAGFAVAADRGDTASMTITFGGNGWNGEFTGTADSSAVTLRPAG